MADVEIKIENNIDATKAEIEKAIKRGLEAIGLIAEGYAKEQTPVDTGRLRNSITHTVDGNDAYIGTNVEYARFVEEGSRYNKAKHMLRNAATGHTAEYQQLMKDSLENA